MPNERGKNVETQLRKYLDRSNWKKIQRVIYKLFDIV